MDVFSPEKRSDVMRAIRGRDTKPELIVRRLVHGMGFRFRLHRKDLPGKPDLVFVRRRKVIFVHGCFWHQHDKLGCRDARLPSTNRDYWLPKLERTKRRDAQHEVDLTAAGWSSLIIWQCEMRDLEALAWRLKAFLQF